MTTRLQVRKGFEWLLSFLNHADWNQRRSSIETQLLAVAQLHTTPIGSEDFKSVSIADDRIGWYRTAAIMQVELPSRTDKAQPLTERQLRDTIARLHRNKFFARCTVSRRITYYSIRLDNEAIRKKVLERRTYPGFFRASQAAQDQVLTATIKQKRREAAQSESRTPPPAPRFSFKLPGQAG